MTRPAYLLTTTIALALILAAVHLAELQRELDRELLEQIQDMQDLLDEADQENTDLREENRELERLHYVRAEQQQILSRGGRPSIPILSPSGFTPDRFEQAFQEMDKPGMTGLGEALVAAERTTGVNALVLAGICALESGWGTSALARDKHNLAGLGAYDGQEYSAGITFASREESILFLARLLRDRPGALAEIGAWYASDPAWASKVAGCMRVIGGGWGW